MPDPAKRAALGVATSGALNTISMPSMCGQKLAIIGARRSHAPMIALQPICKTRKGALDELIGRSFWRNIRKSAHATGKDSRGQSYTFSTIMNSHSILLGLILGAAITAPLAATPSGCGIARAAEIQMPRNQAEFDQFAAQLGNASEAERAAQLNCAGNAFDNGESRLFWFTDLDAARAQAKREGKPILSLRLLGNLSDELSCANSRLFRVLLYPNAQINRQLRENFVLHWSSERPVPVATIDMGDGRVLRRTLTGNSAHYLLSADGQPLDVLPGLYAPAEFATWLQRSADFARDWQAMKVDLRPKMLSDWHRGRLIDSLKMDDSSRAIVEANKIIAFNSLVNDGAITRFLPAQTAALQTDSKRVMEAPVLKAMETPQTATFLNGVRIASFSLPVSPDTPVTFDAATRARIATMQPESEATALIKKLEESAARDTKINKTNFEPAIHAYFVNEPKPDFVKLNRAIYDKLFRTPASDAWLGLAPADAFVALQNGGVQSAPVSQQRVAQTP